LIIKIGICGTYSGKICREIAKKNNVDFSRFDDYWLESSYFLEIDMIFNSVTQRAQRFRKGRKGVFSAFCAFFFFAFFA